LEIEKEGVRIKLRKGSSGYEKAIEYVAHPQSHGAAAQPAAHAAVELKKSNLIEIKSPMVGTFYRSPSPEAPAYVKVGDSISVGQVICIIEAMKLMNEIKSEVKGKIVDIQVDNAEPVEFGQVFFVVEPV
jgi:acetyl-CoA carboxylase biotin carboxyl carrier protein